MQKEITSLEFMLENCKEKHICPVCGKECSKHGRSTKKKPRWRLFCSDTCKLSSKG